MDKWPLGVFTSIDEGLGVKLDVAAELGVSTIQIHAPSENIRNQQGADEVLARLRQWDLSVTAVFGGTDTGSPGHVEGAGPTIVPGDANGVGIPNWYLVDPAGNAIDGS